MLLIVPALLLTLCMIVICAVVRTIAERRQLERLPPAPPSLCPQCGRSEQAVVTYFMWDGVPDPATGDRPHGDFYYATCGACGIRMAQRDRGAPYVPSDEEWRGAAALFDTGQPVDESR